jgi:SAM-dependent methyltransferase
MNELELQETFTWQRSGVYARYNTMLGYYQAQACLRHARGDSLLDIPCGDGTSTQVLARRFRRVVGADASLAHLEEARKRLPGIELHHSLIEDLALAEKFGTVTLLNILEHVIDPVVLLRKAASFLDQDGVLIVHVPNSQAVNRKIAVLMGTLESCEELSPFDVNVAGHRRAYDMGSLRADMERAGLRVVATGGVFYKMLSTPQMDWFLENGPWDEGGFGWGRVGAPAQDWRERFCLACYEYGLQHPEDCNVIYACATLP